MNRQVALSKGMLVRLYEEDDWFWQGRIVELDEEDHVVVDFGDWVQRYPPGSIRFAFTCEGIYEEFLAPFHRGVTIQDFREEEFA